MTLPFDTAVLVALLSGAGFYLCTSRRLLRVLFGFLLLSNAANVALLGVSGHPAGRRAPVLTDAAEGAGASLYVDPLPQALVLTAIVIGFAVAAYLTTLVYRLYCDRGVATVPALFSQAPGAGSPAARESESERTSP